MLSRRTALASVGSGLAVSMAGCSEKLAAVTESEPEAERNEDGLVFRDEFTVDNARVFEYTVDLAEGEYDYDVYHDPANLTLTLTALPEAGSMHAMYIPKTEFDENYREADSLGGFSCVGDADEGGFTMGVTEKEQKWALVVDNTEYLDHNPDGRCEGTLRLGAE